MPEIVNNFDIRIDEKQHEDLARLFKGWIEQVEDSRRRRMEKVWVRALKNYEGHAPTKQFPWFGASNAVLNATQTHSDAIEARLYSASATQDPVYLVRAATNEPVLVDEGVIDEETGRPAALVSAEKFALWWQEISKWIEETQIDHAKLMEEVTWTFVIYGDAYVYIPWEREEVMDVTRNLAGKIEKTPRTLWNRPVPYVLHPKDVYIAPWEQDIQRARSVGFSFMVDEHDLALRKVRKTWGTRAVTELEKLLDKRKSEATGLAKALAAGGYYKEWDNKSYPKDELDKRLADEQYIDDASPNALKMLKIFQRVDMDGDGIPEEIQFEVEKTSGTVAVARYHNLLHNQRPLVHFYYNRRVGAAYNRGVPEILFNGQKILDTLVRDMLDNNKLKNTSIYVGKQGVQGLKKNTKIYPSRLLLLPDPKNDFAVFNLGGTGNVSGVQEIALMQSWSERATGISDPNLGIEKKSRTPASTTMALLEEGSKRTDRVIDRMRKAQANMWWQILCLYRQNADPRELALVAGIEENDRELFMRAWAKVKVQDMAKFLAIKPEVSSSSFNRSVQKQELMTVIGQVENWYMKVAELMSLSAGAAMDPNAQKIYLSFARGGHQLMQKFLALFDVKEQDDLNPDDLIKWIEGVKTIAETQQSQPPRGNPNQPAVSASAGASEPGEGGEAVGRPQAGIPRTPGPTPGVAG